MKNYIGGITHCSFYCNDYEKMLHFYRDILSYRPSSRCAMKTARPG